MPFLDPGLFAFCTDRQREVLETIEREEGHRKAARVLGCHFSYPGKILRDVMKKAALQGYSPAHDMTRTVPEGYVVKGISTLYAADGMVKAQWVKSSQDDVARQEAIRAAVDAMCEDISPVAPIAAPGAVCDRLVTLYIDGIARNRYIDAQRRAAGWIGSAPLLLPLLEGGRVWMAAPTGRYPVISG